MKFPHLRSKFWHVRQNARKGRLRKGYTRTHDLVIVVNGEDQDQLHTMLANTVSYSLAWMGVDMINRSNPGIYNVPLDCANSLIYQLCKWAQEKEEKNG